MKSLDIHSAVSKSKFPLGLPMISNDPVFVSERGAPLSAPGFSPMIERAAVVAKHGIKAYAHMLRHAAGFKITNDGIDTRALQPISATGIFRTQPDAPL